MLLHIFFHLKFFLYRQNLLSNYHKINSKYNTSVSLLSTFCIMLQKSLYCLLRTLRIFRAFVPIKNDQSFYFQMQYTCPKFRIELLRVRCLVRWALSMSRWNLKKNLKETGEKEAPGIISDRAQFLHFCVVFLFKGKQYDLNCFEVEFLSITLPASLTLLLILNCSVDDFNSKFNSDDCIIIYLAAEFCYIFILLYIVLYT